MLFKSQRQDYYPGGMPQPGRGYQQNASKSYRFGFNGKENDNEVKGAGNSVDFGARIYDSRLSRWLSTDPNAQYYSPYVGMGNNPVSMVDPDGGWAHLAAGALIGGGIKMYELYNDGKLGWNLESVSKITYGALEGAIIAGAPTLASSVIASGVGNFGGQMIDNAFAGKKLTNVHIGRVAAAATLGGTGYIIGKPFEVLAVAQLRKAGLTSMARNFSFEASGTSRFIEKVNIPWYYQMRGSLSSVFASQISDQLNKQFMENSVNGLFNNLWNFNRPTMDSPIPHVILPEITIRGTIHNNGTTTF